MTLRYSIKLKDAGLDARIAAVGPSPTLKIYSSAQGLDSKMSGELAALQLPAVWMGKAKDGVATSTEEWKGDVTAKGRAKSFRFFDHAGECHIEGAIPNDLKMQLDSADLSPGHQVVIEVYTLRSGNG